MEFRHTWFTTALFVLGMQAETVSHLITAEATNAVRVVNASVGLADTLVLAMLHILDNIARLESTIALASTVKTVDHVSMAYKMLHVPVLTRFWAANVSLITVSLSLLLTLHRGTDLS